MNFLIDLWNIFWFLCGVWGFIWFMYFLYLSFTYKDKPKVPDSEYKKIDDYFHNLNTFEKDYEEKYNENN